MGGSLSRPGATDSGTPDSYACSVRTELRRQRYNAYQREYQRRRFAARMAEAISLLGGRCVDCGTTDRLHIDHVDPDDKTKALSEMHLWRRDRWLAELAKCQLLCASCHGKKR
jgi:5-methylcytosine-specific restriction endonuclease McrA